MKKNAFTLIELLAVIVILAVIALIVTPTISGIIKNARVSADKRSVEGHVKNVEYQILQKLASFNFIGEQFNGDKTESDLAITYPAGDNITCESYKITSNSVEKANYCKAPTWDKYYCFNKGSNAEECPTVYKDGSGANTPILEDKMIAVLYNGTAWEVADTSKKWYDYDTQEWANAVILNDGVNKNIGDALNLDTDISMMYVWIPRYKYTIFNGNNGVVPSQEINVTFESGTETTGTVTCHDDLTTSDKSEVCSTVTDGVSTYTHPAFTFGSTQLKGFWIGKFENSSTDDTCLTNHNVESCNHVSKIIIKPNAFNWRYASVANQFKSIFNIKTDYNIANADSHMVKNMEWGAVAYLKQSKYGTGMNDIGSNNYNYFKTGCGAPFDASNSVTCNMYDTTKGMLASTNGNITGVYDMSGGSYEWVMGLILDSTGQPYLSGSEFTQMPDAKYYDLYSYDTNKYNYNRSKLGDAIKEVLFQKGENSWNAWNDDFTYLPSNQFKYSWQERSSNNGSGKNGGIFNASNSDGAATYAGSSRSIIVHNS